MCESNTEAADTSRKLTRLLSHQTAPTHMVEQRDIIRAILELSKEAQPSDESRPKTSTPHSYHSSTQNPYFTQGLKHAPSQSEEKSTLVQDSISSSTLSPLYEPAYSSAKYAYSGDTAPPPYPA